MQQFTHVKNCLFLVALLTGTLFACSFAKPQGCPPLCKDGASKSASVDEAVNPSIIIDPMVLLLLLL
jgi:hypothetical protein